MIHIDENSYERLATTITGSGKDCTDVINGVHIYSGSEECSIEIDTHHTLYVNVNYLLEIKPISGRWNEESEEQLIGANYHVEIELVNKDGDRVDCDFEESRLLKQLN